MLCINTLNPHNSDDVHGTGGQFGSLSVMVQVTGAWLGFYPRRSASTHLTFYHWSLPGDGSFKVLPNLCSLKESRADPTGSVELDQLIEFSIHEYFEKSRVWTRSFDICVRVCVSGMRFVAKQSAGTNPSPQVGFILEEKKSTPTE